MIYKIIFMLYSLIVFISYIEFTIKQGLIADSVSATYYNLKRKWIFSFFIVSSAFPLVYIVQSWKMFIAGGLICLVAAAPAFRNTKREEIAHMIGASGGFALGILDITLMGYWYITIAGTIVARLVQKYAKYKVYWVEVVGYFIIWIPLWIETCKEFGGSF